VRLILNIFILELMNVWYSKICPTRCSLEKVDRPELGVTLTKLHCWQLTQYRKCVFLDADTLVYPLLTN